LCSREAAVGTVLSRSHLIPESIGGFAWARTHCKPCNEETGAKIEAEIVHDDSIRFSIKAVSSSLPKLASAFQAKTTYAARTPHGLVKARRQGDGFEILAASDGDSRTSSREHARAALKTRLSRAGCSADEIAEAIGVFDRAEIGVPIEIGGATVTHGAVEDFDPELRGVVVSTGFPSLIAFHFLALAIGPNAYDERLDSERRSGEEQHRVHGIGSRAALNADTHQSTSSASPRPHRISSYGCSFSVGRCGASISRSSLPRPRHSVISSTLSSESSWLQRHA
jgi:hypothetical protein